MIPMKTATRGTIHVTGNHAVESVSSNESTVDPAIASVFQEPKGVDDIRLARVIRAQQNRHGRNRLEGDSFE